VSLCLTETGETLREARTRRERRQREGKEVQREGKKETAEAEVGIPGENPVPMIEIETASQLFPAETLSSESLLLPSSIGIQ